MKDEEIKAEMEKYTEALKQKFKGFDYDPDDEEKKAEYFRQAKDNAHKVAIECLNKILTPELKIFIKNLCLDRLDYPDEPVFYKVFGDYPKEGDFISFADIEKLQIDSSYFINDIACVWLEEDSCWLDDEIKDEKKGCSISFIPKQDEETTKQRRELIKQAYRLKRSLATNPSISDKDKSELYTFLDKVTNDLDKLQY